MTQSELGELKEKALKLSTGGEAFERGLEGVKLGYVGKSNEYGNEGVGCGGREKKERL